MFGNVFGYGQPQQYQQAYPHAHAHAQAYPQAHAQAHGHHGHGGRHGGKAVPKSPKAVAQQPTHAPTVTNANHPYAHAMMPYTGQGYPQYAQQQPQQQQQVNGGYPQSLIATPGMAGGNELNQVAANLWIGSCRALQPHTLSNAAFDMSSTPQKS